MKKIHLMLIVSMFWGQPTTLQAMQADERVESLVVQTARVAARMLRGSLEDRVGRIIPGNVDQTYDSARGLLTGGGGLPAEVRNRVVRSYGVEYGWQCTPHLECTYATRGADRHYTHVGYAVDGRLVALEVANDEVGLYDGHTHEMVDRCAWDCRARMPYAVHVGAHGTLAASGARRVRVHNVGNGQLTRGCSI